MHVSTQLSLLDCYLIIRKYEHNELNHRDRAQILSLNFLIIIVFIVVIHVSTQLSILDSFLIIRKYYELNHHDPAHHIYFNRL